jgi:hypothetical protein
MSLPIVRVQQQTPTTSSSLSKEGMTIIEEKQTRSHDRNVCRKSLIFLGKSVQKTKSSHNTVLNEITMKVLIINVSNFDS